MPIINKQKNGIRPLPPASRSIDSIGGVDGWSANQYIRMIFYGKSGTGKTTSWASFPGKTLALLCSGGDSPGELTSVDNPENRDRITARVIKSTDQIRGYLDLAKSGEFANVVIDHASGLQDLCLKEVLGLEEIPIQKVWGVAQQQQWGTCTVMAKEVLRAVLSLSCNAIIVAQERVFAGKEGEEAESSDLVRPTVGPAMTPSLAGWLAPAVDYVVHTYLRPRMRKVQAPNPGGKPVTTEERVKGEVEYCLRTGPHDVFLTKFRKPRDRVLPECLVIGRTDSAYDKLMTLIKV